MLDDATTRIIVGFVEAATVDLARLRRTGEVQSEDHITSRLIDRIRVQVDDLKVNGIRWSAVETVSQGKDSQERATGADLLAVLRIDVPPVTLTKGFLAQAKILQPGIDLEDLKRQCNAMLHYTPDAYAWLYDETGVWVAPAITVASANPPAVPTLQSLGGFFDMHLRSWIGDRKFTASTRDQLEALRGDFRARRALMLDAEFESSE